ncbi:MAG: GNAT family N-acetyltransferase [Bacteroidetes bacterium]|nr:GNAT family N-acetyltransferase [Bacteroidota bacterium]
MLLTWQLFSWEELTTEVLYTILALRAEVFIVEQECAYLDTDGKDKEALHVCAFDKNQLIGYARVFLHESPCSIGRVLVKKERRGKHIGQRLMEKCIALIPAEKEVFISAQEHLKTFYESLGFTQSGTGYLEDGIPHIPLLLISRNAS